MRRLFDPLIPLSQLEEHLRERETAVSDQVVSANSMSVDDQTGNLIVRNGCSREHPFQPHALQLLATKLRVPHSYLVRCPPDLRATNINHWLRRKTGQRFFLRFDGDECRAVLSERYRPVSNVQVVETLRQKAGNALVRCELDNLRLIVQVVNGRSVEASPGDRLYGGLHARNSEVGFMAVELRAMIYRTICLNGLIMGASDGIAFRRRHVTEPVEVLARFGLAAERAIEEGSFLPRRFADTKLIRVPDVEPVFERISSRYHLDDAEQDAIWNAWAMEPGEHLYAVINSLTRAGNDRGLGIEAREKLQQLGGRLLGLASKGQKWID